MEIDHIGKRIIYEPHELLMATNYYKHCVPPKERKDWKFVLSEIKPQESLKKFGR